MEQEEKEILWALIISVPLILLALAAPIFALDSCFRPESESVEVWFQRSGALTVMFAVWVEYNLSKVNEHINLSGVVVSSQTRLSKKYKIFYKITEYLGVLLAISGTIIWGYGDLLI